MVKSPARCNGLTAHGTSGLNIVNAGCQLADNDSVPHTLMCKCQGPFTFSPSQLKTSHLITHSPVYIIISNMLRSLDPTCCIMENFVQRITWSGCCLQDLAPNIEFLQKYHVWCVVMWSSSKPLQKGHAFQNGILVCLYGSHGFLDGILLEI